MEQELIRVLWDNGKIRKGERLVARRVVLKEVGTIKGKSEELTNLYNQLVKNGDAEFNICYIAKKDMKEVLSSL